jgi:antitoxin PrlF
MLSYRSFTSHHAQEVRTDCHVSSKGQVVIPGDVRKRLGLVQGSVLRFVLDADSVRLLPAAGNVRRLKGRLPRPEAPVSISNMNRTRAERRAGIGCR